MIAKLEEAFNITFEMDDIIDFSSFSVGKKFSKNTKLKFNLKNKKKIISLNSVELQSYQPNRYPFLIDHVDLVVPGVEANGYKILQIMNGFSNSFSWPPKCSRALQLEALAQMLTVAITTLPDQGQGNSCVVTCS